MKVKGEKKVYWVISVWKESGNIYTYVKIKLQCVGGKQLKESKHRASNIQKLG